MANHSNLQKNRIFQLNKQNVPIGIFGSFKYYRILHLENLRDYLNANNYFAQLSEDIDPHFHDGTFVKPAGYDLKISKKLIISSKIHIFVFNKERINEHHINESPAIELTYLHSLLETGSLAPPKIIIYTQNGIESNIGGLLKDLILDCNYWRHFPFNNLEDIHEHALTTCNGFINSY